MTVSIQSAVAKAGQVLRAAGIDHEVMEGSLLLAHVLGRDRTFVIAHADETLAPTQLDEFQLLVARRAAGEPLEYITGHQEFFGLDFKVNPDVLIPRPETELIVEAALELLKDNAAPYFADIGTGSGCIAVSLLHELLNARALATDISSVALQVARSNAARHGVSERLRLIESDGCAAIDVTESFDLVVSNPPYVSDEEMKALQREVRREPVAALAGGADGFSIIRRLLHDAPAHLTSGGLFIFEIGFGQSERVKELIDVNVWELIEMRRDLQGIPRTVVLRRN